MTTITKITDNATCQDQPGSEEKGFAWQAHKPAWFGADPDKLYFRVSLPGRPDRFEWFRFNDDDDVLAFLKNRFDNDQRPLCEDYLLWLGDFYSIEDFVPESLSEPTVDTYWELEYEPELYDDARPAPTEELIAAASGVGAVCERFRPSNEDKDS